MQKGKYLKEMEICLCVVCMNFVQVQGLNLVELISFSEQVKPHIWLRVVRQYQKILAG